MHNMNYSQGKSRLYPTYSISSSDAEESPIHRGLYNLPYNTPSHQYPITYKPTAGLSDTPSSENASDATLTDTEIAAARDKTLLVNNGEFPTIYTIYKRIPLMVSILKISTHC